MLQEPELPPTGTAPWVTAIVTVVFDLEEGQLVDTVIPEGIFDKKECKALAYNSFPDSFSFSGEGRLDYTFLLKKDLPGLPGTTLQCFTSFMQKRDATNPRGFFQKSVVLVTAHTHYTMFKSLVAEMASDYLEGLDDSLLQSYYDHFQGWPAPGTQPVLNLDFKGKVYQAKVQQFNKKMAFSDRCLSLIQLKVKSAEDILKADEEEEEKKHKEKNIKFSLDDGIEGGEDNDNDDQDSEMNEVKEEGELKSELGEELGIEISKKQELKLEEALSSMPYVQGDFQDINLFNILHGKKVLLWYKLWEIMMLNQSLLVVADSPSTCSDLVYALQSIISPFRSSSEYYPYLTVFTQGLSDIEKSMRTSKNGVIIGVTNPLFLKVIYSLNTGIFDLKMR